MYSFIVKKFFKGKALYFGTYNCIFPLIFKRRGPVFHFALSPAKQLAEPGYEHRMLRKFMPDVFSFFFFLLESWGQENEEWGE